MPFTDWGRSAAEVDLLILSRSTDVYLLHGMRLLEPIRCVPNRGLFTTSTY